MNVQEKVLHYYRVNDETGCWEWTEGKDPDGYGLVYCSETGKYLRAHRVSYEVHVGPIPEGLVTDHLCRNPSCIRPDHLEPVTVGENVLRGEGLTARQARQTQCKHGHEFTPENTRLDTRGHRICQECNRAKVRRRYYAKRNRPAPLTDEQVQRIEAAR